MFRMYASNSHRYTHLILALGIVREPTLWVLITSKYPGTHDIGLLRIWACKIRMACDFVWAGERTRVLVAANRGDLVVNLRQANQA